ncbi:HAMP domain-containing sensor histidine kinase [Clostridium paraputrificum]|uniref:HAMP domain-containing sensor histidine kinase n=1 Tax=Clostridium paraputrificum TaxID=29363 RepID=UPI000665C093|nr:HAMP domain-containing sensor histidine kinase [Clostridium paraputrificum]MDB2107030.1 ATP-binding protein [Clostridium paraputrificum]MDB2113085.1 ATP-binding protein [Clostridium paraputrificum]
MRKKILTSVIITVLFALIIACSSFVVLYNYQDLNSTKKSLKDFANYIVNVNGDYEDLISGYRINNTPVRCTVIDKNGNVVYDSVDKDLNTHRDRDEVIKANKYGEGYSTRISETTGKKTVYYAEKLEDGTILRASLPFETIDIFEPTNLKVCIGIVTIVMLFSVSLSMKLVRTIIEPLKNLENVTARIAGGDLNIRVKSLSNDEIGSLGKTFNNMADQLQAKIREVVDKQNRLESILRSMESGVIAVDGDDTVITINPYAKRVFGIRRDISGEKISKYIKDYDINTFLNEEDDSEKEVKILHPVERELRIKKASIIDGIDRIGKVIAVQDISDIKRLENMRSQFVANVSHELKTPLTSIKGFTETLKYVEDEETRKKFLDIIEKEADRLGRLINDILILSKIESDISGEEDEFLPNKVVDDVINMVKVLADNKNITIELDERNYDLLFGDKDRFLQLVLNIVENSIKYSNEGSTVKISSFTKGDNYNLIVEDNGIGIPKEDIPRIFERFYRVDKARKSGGTGLGLAIVKHIVKTFNGNIKVESVLGVGSKFIIQIKHI